MQEYIFSLYETHGVGPVFYSKLVRAFGSPKNAVEAPLEELEKVVPTKIAVEIKRIGNETLQQKSKFLEQTGIKCIDFTSNEYPENFKIHEMFPPVLFYRGKKLSCEKPSIAVVGTRKPTRYGVETTIKLVSQLVKHGFSIVSGGARGIDTVAHKTALQEGGYTIAVLGCGVDIYYPVENRNLFQQIANSGTLLSEFLPGTKPLKENFPKRNRLIAGLAKGVLIIEAGETSGSLITAKWALEMGKEVYSVPGPINSSVSFGCNRLIKDGAKIVLSVEDILEDFGVRHHPEENSYAEEKLGPEARKILEMLNSEAVHFDELLSKLSIPTPDLLAILFELEINGLIIELPGKYYKRQ